MAVWVCPHCPQKSAERKIEKIQGLNRLYAYPCEPKFVNNGLVILDSGAFGLSHYGGKITFSYMQKLSAHYEKYYRDGVLCVAPDVFLNPHETMMNFMKWHRSKLFPNISPVLQPDNDVYFSRELLLRQAEFYCTYSETVFVGVPKSLAMQPNNLQFWEELKSLKNMGYRWIHALGVGWTLQGIKEWANMPYLNSFDSIAYYTTRNVNAFGSLNPVKNVEEILKWTKNISL